MYKTDEYLIKGISALLPVYEKDIGDITILIDKEGNRIPITRKLRTVIISLASHFSYDLVNIRKKFGKLIQRKHKVPIPLQTDLILVPVKFRIPMLKNDSSMAYVNSKCIKYYKKNGNNCKIILTNGIELPLIQSYNCTRQNFINAELAAREFISNINISSEMNCNINWFSNQSIQPSTKADIAILFEKINKITRHLGID